MNRTLKARIERLERQRVRRVAPRLVYSLYSKSDAEVIGYRMTSGLVVMRTPEEPLDALQARAWAVEPSIALETLYTRSTAHHDDVAEPSAPPVPPEPVNPLDDYFARAGVGVEATTEQLWESGAVRGPPERLR